MNPIALVNACVPKKAQESSQLDARQRLANYMALGLNHSAAITELARDIISFQISKRQVKVIRHMWSGTDLSKNAFSGVTMVSPDHRWLVFSDAEKIYIKSVGSPEYEEVVSLDPRADCFFISGTKQILVVRERDELKAYKTLTECIHNIGIPKKSLGFRFLLAIDEKDDALVYLLFQMLNKVVSCFYPLALVKAIKVKNVGAVELLLSVVDAKTIMSRKNNTSPIEIALKNFEFSIFNALLLKVLACPFYKSEKHQVLEHLLAKALRDGNVLAVKMLLSFGVDLSQAHMLDKPYGRLFPLNIAVEKGNSCILDMLLNTGMVIANDRELFRIAVKHGRCVMVSQLLMAGVDRRAVDEIMYDAQLAYYILKSRLTLGM
ncbi:hypothetical protein GCM10023116_12630 [Kistimonas scapharcae]|uniref:Ankyrin repeat protein n=1 Tax=Kistimonas scapharcae TaxID=1036133 RepID=A0ABP8V0K6_9GAMM